MTPPNAPWGSHLVQVFDPYNAVWHIIDRRNGRLHEISEWPQKGVRFDYTLPARRRR